VGAETPKRRTMTAREAAARTGLHPVTIRRLMAEPRGEFLARAKARRDRVLELRAKGLKHREIAEELGVPIGTVGRLLHEAKKSAQDQELAERPQAS
jgi:transposase